MSGHSSKPQQQGAMASQQWLGAALSRLGVQEQGAALCEQQQATTARHSSRAQWRGFVQQLYEY